MGWWQDMTAYLEKEGATLKKAPLAFVSLLALGLAGGAIGGLAWRGQEVANLESTIRLKDAELATAKSSQAPTPASTADAPSDQGRLDFTPEEIRRLREILSQTPSFIEIWQGSPNRWTDTIRKTFAESGWKIGSFTPAAVYATAEPPIMLRWTDAAATPVIRKAFDEAGFSYQLSEGDDGNLVALWADAVLKERAPPSAP